MTTPAPKLPRPGSPGAWLLASRPKTLTAAWAPVLVGTAIAHAAGSARLDVALAAMAGASLIQIGTNFANDVFDFEKGADDADRLGPTRAVQAGLLGPRQMRAGMVVAFALALAAGAYLVAVGGWPVVAIGVASIASGVAYTGGPYPLGYNGLGDVFVMAFFGFVAVVATTWLQTGTIEPAAFVCGAGVGGLATAILAINNLRDAATDVRAGKRTIVVRFGVAAGRAEYAVMVALAAAVAPALVFGFHAPVATFASWLALVPLAAAARALYQPQTGPQMNALLARTAALLFVYSVLLSAGLALGR
ncbi:MAG: 1,4-dihydroxy-2-naphthoate polyprenyltransferase [Myxococcales bacterium]|nr:1,4-dihydroxy-2-naphthoate polyprenyltransferase [Myxococcales bacterium]MCB9530308.1 1,4-dihydroxy-2-naphthoate polyprenyltransferase [Myxococcales bacterium]